MVLVQGAAGAAGGGPEGTIVTGKAVCLRHQGGVTGGAIDIRINPDHIVVLVDCRTFCPLAVVALLTAVDVGAGTVTDSTVHAVVGGILVVLRTGVAAGVAAAAGAVEDDGGVTGGAIASLSWCAVMMPVTGIQIGTPESSVMTDGAIGNIRRIGVAGGATDVSVGNRHVVVLGAVRQPRSVAVLATGAGVDADRDGVVADTALDADALCDLVVTILGFTRVTVVAVIRPRSVAVTGRTVDVIGCGVGVVPVAGRHVGAPKGCIVAGQTIIRSLCRRVAVLTGKAFRSDGGVMLIADVTGVTVQTTVDRLHGRVTAGTVDRVDHARGARVVIFGGVVRGLDLALMTAQAHREFTDTGVTMGTVTGQRGS